MRSHIKSLLLTALAATVLMAGGAVEAQDYPSKRITFVAPIPPGARPDTLARVIARRLSARERLGQPVIVEARPGARSFIGHDRVAKARPDGYTILLAGQPLSLPVEQAHMLESFDFSGLAPLGRVASSPFVVAVSRNVPARTLKELVAHARANPQVLNYGVVTNTGMQLDLLQFARVLDAPMTEVPFRSLASIATALLGNHIQMSFLSDLVIPYGHAGRLRALAVTSKERWSHLPEVPSMGELGIDFESGFWYGIAVPAATPQSIQHRLVREFAEVMNMSDVRDTVFKLGMDALVPSPAEMIQHIRRERAQAEAALKLLKARAEPTEDEPRGGGFRIRRSGQRDVPGGP